MSYLDEYNQSGFGNYSDDFQKALNELAPGMQQFTQEAANHAAQYHAEQYAGAIERLTDHQMMFSEELAELEYLKGLDRQQGTNVRGQAIAKLQQLIQQAEIQGINDALGGM